MYDPRHNHFGYNNEGSDVASGATNSAVLGDYLSRIERSVGAHGASTSR